jgi:hypothetical protein
MDVPGLFRDGQTLHIELDSETRVPPGVPSYTPVVSLVSAGDHVRSVRLPVGSYWDYVQDDGSIRRTYIYVTKGSRGGVKARLVADFLDDQLRDVELTLRFRRPAQWLTSRRSVFLTDDDVSSFVGSP